MAENWFTIDKINDFTYAISEYRHPEETHCYLLLGEEKTLLIDSGLGVCNIYEQVLQLTDKPLAAVATHVHWDHIGGHQYFSEWYAHSAELPWLQGEFPLPKAAIQKMLAGNCDLPKEYDAERYELFQGIPTRLLEDGDVLELGNRSIKVLHTPGHSPGHMCFWDALYGFMYTGDLIYKGLLYANYTSTDPGAYLKSVEKIAKYPVRRLFPGHHSLEISTNLLPQVKKTLQSLQSEGRLCHGSGRLDYEDWSILL
ncbi:MAG: MBL fold metallo-hydrolase [Clostridia bacterium]|nr:MBL fold metallo-hydrolase [Clostridia bacterium]